MIVSTIPISIYYSDDGLIKAEVFRLAGDPIYQVKVTNFEKNTSTFLDFNAIDPAEEYAEDQISGS